MWGAFGYSESSSGNCVQQHSPGRAKLLLSRFREQTPPLAAAPQKLRPPNASGLDKCQLHSFESRAGKPAYIRHYLASQQIAVRFPSTAAPTYHAVSCFFSVEKGARNACFVVRSSAGRSVGSCFASDGSRSRHSPGPGSTTGAGAVARRRCEEDDGPGRLLRRDRRQRAAGDEPRLHVHRRAGTVLGDGKL